MTTQVTQSMRAILCTSLLFVAILAPTTTIAEKKLDRIVAIVENEAITERELFKNVLRAKTMLSQQNREMPDERIIAGQVLQQMIIQRLQLQEAKRLGITMDEITLDRAVTDMAKRNNLTLVEFKQKIESNNGSFQELRQHIRNEFLIQRLIQNQVINQIKVSEQEIENILMLDGKQQHETKYHFAQIWVPPQTSDDALATAKKLLLQVRNKLRDTSFSSLEKLRKRFAQLWKTTLQKNDVKGLRYQIKSLDWRRVESLPKPVRSRIDSLRKMGTSPVISNDKGLYLFQLISSRRNNEEMMQLQYHVRHILIQTNPIDNDAKVQKKLVGIKRKLENGADFRNLACAYSQDPLSSMKGGDLGWADLKNYVPEFAEAVTQARGKGDIVGPFKTTYGWHILEIIDVREQDVADDTLKQQAIAQIKKSKSEESTKLWLLRLRENSRIEIRI